MARRIVDLSVALDADIPSDPPPLRPQITYLDHAAGAAEMEQMFGVPVDNQLEGAGTAERHHA